MEHASSLERRFEHGPKKVYRLLRHGKFREVMLILRCEFDQDPEFFSEIVDGVYSRLTMAVKNQAKNGHGSDAKMIWLPAFAEAIENATGMEMRDFVRQDPEPRRAAK